jgi:hypothetical protein
MPVLPLEHFEPFAATLGVMLYPGLDEDDQRKARAFAAQWLAIPVRRLYEAGHTMPNDALARIVMDGGTLLTDVLSENYIRTYSWCGPAKMGLSTMAPD